jgi:PAS domain S-box-containing protein
MSTDASRLAALRSYNVLDTPPEPQFDDIVQLARVICRTPIALVSFVDEKRQWFKAKAGVDVDETPIGQSVCTHAINEPEILIIPDLTLDSRSTENTLVTDGPKIRFYAGAVLRTPQGEALGALCVIDTVPRPEGLNEEQTDALLALARQTMILLQFRRSVSVRDQVVQKTYEHAQSLESAQQAGGVGSFEIDLSDDTIFPSPEFCRIFGLTIEHSLAARDVEALILRTDQGGSTLTSRIDGTAALEAQYRIRRQFDGEVRWIWRRSEFERDAKGNPVRMRGTVQDITESKTIEELQKTLNEELSHRMKNTLAMVEAIASQTLRNASDQPAVETFGRRVHALGRAHDVLLQQSMGASVRSTIEAVVGVIADLKRFELKGADMDLNARSVMSFSLLIHELTTNALKYGALSKDGGNVTVSWGRGVDDKDKAEFSLDWRESGGPPVQEPERKGFGSRLIKGGFSGTGRSEVRYAPEGLHATFHVPLSFVSR